MGIEKDDCVKKDVDRGKEWYTVEIVRLLNSATLRDAMVTYQFLTSIVLHRP